MVRFTIITVAYNAGDKLRETVEGILRQTYDNYEIVVKDGLSKDNSVEKLPQSSKINLVSCADKSIYDAMNQAIEQAQGDYIIFMNCGDFFYNENVLRDVAAIIEQNPEKGIYYGDVFCRSSNAVDYSPKEVSDFVCFRHIPCHQACVFARELFEDGCFKIQYKIRADYEFFLRQYYRKNIRPMYTGVIIADYEGGGYSETKENKARSAKEHKEITEMYMSKGQLRRYKFILAATLAPLRTKISESPGLAGMYNKCKSILYRNKQK